jgi:hypothetical protein
MAVRVLAVLAILGGLLQLGGRVDAASVACRMQNTGTLLVSADTGAPVCRLGPTVTTAVADRRGGWFAVDSATGAVRLVHVLHDGALDARWHVSLPRGARVTTLEVEPPMLYAAGSFGVIAYSSWTGLRRWHTSVTLHDRDALWVDVAASPSAVFVGGALRAIGGVHIPLAALDPRDGHVLPWRAASLDRQIVTALALADGTLFVGGGFGHVGGRRRLELAALSAQTGRVLRWVANPDGRGRWIPGTVGDSDRLVVSTGLLFSGSRYDGFGITDIQTGKASTWMQRIEGSPDVFAAAGSVVYLGVSNGHNGLSAVDGVERDGLAAIDVRSGRLLPWKPPKRLTEDAYGKTWLPVPSGDRVLLCDP